jgi:hypothetical protein
MTSWRNADWKDFLANRMFLYELCELCAVNPTAYPSPTMAVGLDRHFSDWVCFEIDKGLAQWRLWYTARMHAMKRKGKYGTEPKYDSMDDILGITAARQMGWLPESQDEDRASEDYKAAILAAAREGKELPDIVEFMEEREWAHEANPQDAEWY